jgi:hypothetical protein
MRWIVEVRLGELTKNYLSPESIWLEQTSSRYICQTEFIAAVLTGNPSRENRHEELYQILSNSQSKISNRHSRRSARLSLRHSPAEELNI